VNDTQGYVYVWGGEGVYKIGRAKNPHQRVKSFPVTPYKAGFVHILPADDYKRLEQSLHAHFRAKRVKGEWFNLSEQELHAIPDVAGVASIDLEQPDPNQMGWRLLVSLEPRLQGLLDDAKAVRDRGDTKSFCANNVWYDRFKPRLIQFVGWEASKLADPRLRTMEAYDIAYEKVHEALPNCRYCWCIPSKP
jgi:hypothetical protein